MRLPLISAIGGVKACFEQSSSYDTCTFRLVNLVQYFCGKRSEAKYCYHPKTEILWMKYFSNTLLYYGPREYRQCEFQAWIGDCYAQFFDPRWNYPLPVLALWRVWSPSRACSYSRDAWTTLWVRDSATSPLRTEI